MLRGHKANRRSVGRGFTLMELLAVVAMIGILSALAVVGYRKYLNASKSGDAKAIISAIRVAEESYRAETLVYLSCSDNLGEYYPVTTPNGKKRHWVNSSHPKFDRWSTLNVSTDSPTSYVFAVVAGPPGQNPPQPATGPGGWSTPTEPWYVIQAAGDADVDKVLSYFVASSFTSEIYAQNEAE
jgi:type IV pilus assembly protein PilA